MNSLTPSAPTPHRVSHSLDSPHSGTGPWSTIDPHHHWVFLRLVPRLKKVKEEILAICGIDVARVRAGRGITPSLVGLDADLVILLSAVSTWTR